MANASALGASRGRWGVFSLALIAGAIAAPVHAQSIDSIFAAYTTRTPGCAVAAVDSTRTVVSQGFGMASLEHGLTITPTTAFYAASVSKQFTAFAVALLARQGKLALDDDVRKWLPEVPQFGNTITVRHQIHHTSGLRDYFGLLGMTGWPSDGPITERQFLDLVGRQKALNFEPGARHLYSNTGYVLLAILVKRVSGQSLREFADAHIFAPLGMTNSQFRDDHTMLIRNRALADGSPRSGEWRLNVPGFDVVGDGGLYTTVEDLARWARNFDNRIVGDSALATLTVTRGQLNGGSVIPYAFGLVNNNFRGQPTIEHGGAYGGYRAHLMRFPRLHFTVVMLCNAASANAANLSQRVATALLGERLPAVSPVTSSTAPAEPVVSLTRQQVAPFAGPYWSAGTEQLRRLELRDSVLSLAGGAALMPLADQRFRSLAGVTYVFSRQAKGVVQLEETLPSGERITYTRMLLAKTDTATLASYTGDYYSDEIAHTWRIEAKNGRLQLSVRGSGEIVLDPVFADAFQSPAGVLRFQRAANGRITGFIVGAGRVTGFRFVRTDG